MVANAFFAATVLGLALALYLLQECQFLIPYRSLLFYKYGGDIALFAVVVFINLFAAIYAITQLVFLKDTGKKLAHLEKQLRTGTNVSEELSERLKEE
jgi:hypothetical protein